MDSKKSNKIREIVRLQQILKKWKKLANASKATRTSAAAASNTTTSNTSGSKSIKFLKRTISFSDTSAARDASTNAVRKGYLAVSVGEEQKRFIIRTEYLSHQAFQMLLREAEEEFGFQQAGVLRIPCEVALFESILKMVEEKKEMVFKQQCRSTTDDILGYCSSEGTPSHHPQSPLCR